MWFILTRNRPRELTRLLAEWPKLNEPTVVMIDGPTAPYVDVKFPVGVHRYNTPDHLEMCGALNYCYKSFPNEPWYGWIGDDSVPVTPNFAADLVAAAGRWNVSVCNDRLHPVGWWTPGVTGGELLRELGWWAPPGLIHLYIDDVWHHLNDQLGIFKHCPDVVIEEYHFSNGKAPYDDTYKRVYKGEEYAAKDKATFENWRASQDTREVIARIRKRLEGMR